MSFIELLSWGEESKSVSTWTEKELEIKDTNLTCTPKHAGSRALPSKFSSNRFQTTFYILRWFTCLAMETRSWVVWLLKRQEDMQSCVHTHRLQPVSSLHDVSCVTLFLTPWKEDILSTQTDTLKETVHPQIGGGGWSVPLTARNSFTLTITCGFYTPSCGGLLLILFQTCRLVCKVHELYLNDTSAQIKVWLSLLCLVCVMCA